MKLLRYFWLLLLFPVIPLPAQQLYLISDTVFLQYLHDSIPNCVRNDSLIIDSAHLSTHDILILDYNNNANYINMKNVDGIQFFDHTQTIDIQFTQIRTFPHLVSDSLRQLTLNNTSISLLPALDSLPNLNILSLSDDSNLISLQDLSRLANLSKLIIYSTPIDSLPPLDSLSQLTNLEIESVPIHSISNFYNNKKLINILINNTNIDSIPSLDSCLLLNSLVLGNNNLYKIPSLDNNTQLADLQLNNEHLPILPSLSRNTLLKYLGCAFIQIKQLPDLSQNTQLDELDVYHCLLDSLPDLSHCSMLEILDVDSNNLIDIPDLTYTSLLSLSASANHLTRLPAFPSSLTDLDLSHNLLTVFPEPYYSFSKNWILNDNLISALPESYTSDSFGVVDISQNKLDFSDAQGMKIIDELMIDYTFINDGFPESADYTYAPQKPFGEIDTVTVDTYSDTVLTIADQHYADSYQWYHDGAIIPGAVDTLLHIYCATQADAGIYTCHSIGQYFNTHSFRFHYGVTEFVSEPQTLLVSPTIGRSSLAALYPAVSSGMLTLRYALPEAQGVWMKIYDLKGSLVSDYEYGTQTKSEYTQSLDLSGLASGSYIAHLQYSLGYSQTIRFVIAH